MLPTVHAAFIEVPTTLLVTSGALTLPIAVAPSANAPCQTTHANEDTAHSQPEVARTTATVFLKTNAVLTQVPMTATPFKTLSPVFSDTPALLYAFIFIALACSLILYFSASSATDLNCLPSVSPSCCVAWSAQNTRWGWHSTSHRSCHAGFDTRVQSAARWQWTLLRKALAVAVFRQPSMALCFQTELNSFCGSHDSTEV